MTLPLPPRPSPVDARALRRLEGLSAWNAMRTEIERTDPGSGLPPEQRRQRELLERADRALHERTRRERPPQDELRVTAVLAVRLDRSSRELARALDGRDVDVQEVTAQGGVALGVVVAEQPDLLVVGPGLLMLADGELVTLAARFAPSTLVVRAAPGDAPEALAVRSVRLLERQGARRGSRRHLLVSSAGATADASQAAAAARVLVAAATRAVQDSERAIATTRDRLRRV